MKLMDDVKVYQKSTLGILFHMGSVAFSLILIPLLTLPMLVILSIALLPFVMIWDYFYQKTFRYELNEQGVMVKSGIIGKSQNLYLFTQIQDVNETQSFVQRIFDLKDIRISTLTSQSQAGGSISALTSEDATNLRGEILERMKRPNANSIEGKTSLQLKTAPKIKIPEKDYFPSEKLYRPYIWVIGGVIALFGIFSFISIAFAFMGFIIILSALFFLLLQYLYCRYTTIKLTEDGLLIKTGFLSKLTTLIPLEKIQDIYFNKGPFDRLLGTTSLKAISGETSIYAQNEKYQPPTGVRGLDLKDAIELREILLKNLLGKLPEEDEILGDRSEHPLDNSSPMVWSIAKFLVFLPILIFGVLAFLASPSNPLVILALSATIALLVLIFVMNYLFFNSISYSFTKTAFVIQRGVIFIDTVTIPVKNIQDVYVNQGLLDRVFGLYSVEMSTISLESKKFLKFSSFTEQNANNLRNLISKIISKK